MTIAVDLGGKAKKQTNKELRLGSNCHIRFIFIEITSDQISQKFRGNSNERICHNHLNFGAVKKEAICTHHHFREVWTPTSEGWGREGEITTELSLKGLEQ